MPLRSNQIRATKSAGNEWGLPLQKLSEARGIGFSTLAGVAKSDFVVKSGEMKLYSDSDTDTGNTVERYFCGNCGSPIYSAVPDSPDVFFLKTGTLADTTTFTPQFHIWCSSKQNWVDLAEDVPAMQKAEGLS